MFASHLCIGYRPKVEPGRDTFERIPPETYLAIWNATLFLTIIVLLPAADGSLSLRFTSGLTIPSSPHPEAPGTANALSTLVVPVNFRIGGTTDSSMLISPMLPEMGLFGEGGLVVPVVRLTLDGLLFVPM